MQNAEDNWPEWLPQDNRNERKKSHGVRKNEQNTGNYLPIQQPTKQARNHMDSCPSKLIFPP